MTPHILVRVPRLPLRLQAPPLSSRPYPPACCIHKYILERDTAGCDLVRQTLVSGGEGNPTLPIFVVSLSFSLPLLPSLCIPPSLSPSLPRSLVSSPPPIYTYTHACMHACMHTYVYLYICACVRVCARLSTARGFTRHKSAGWAVEHKFNNRTAVGSAMAAASCWPTSPFLALLSCTTFLQYFRWHWSSSLGLPELN